MLPFRKSLLVLILSLTAGMSVGGTILLEPQIKVGAEAVEANKSQAASDCSAVSSSGVRRGSLVADSRQPTCCGQCKTSGGKSGCSKTDSKGKTTCQAC